MTLKNYVAGLLNAAGFLKSQLPVPQPETSRKEGKECPGRVPSVSARAATAGSMCRFARRPRGDFREVRWRKLEAGVRGLAGARLVTSAVPCF